MPVNERFIPVRKTARYYVYGNSGSKNIKTIWLVFHGYGMLAREFIKNFSDLDDGNTIIVAPEGLNMFYTSSLFGKTGSSWMTKENRENEIKDYTAYISSLWNVITEDINPDSVKINLLGFSQGVSTLVRWLNHAKIKTDNIILWAGTFPEEIDYHLMSPAFNKSNLIMVFGKGDRLIDAKTADKQIVKLKESGIRHETHYYEGKHELTPVLMKEIFRMLK